MDAAEAHLVEELVFAAWRQVRLRAVEDAVLARAERGEPPSPNLPSLATLMRYRGRIERDGRQGASGPGAPALARRTARAGASHRRGLRTGQRRSTDDRNRHGRQQDRHERPHRSEMLGWMAPDGIGVPSGGG